MTHGAYRHCRHIGHRIRSGVGAIGGIRSTESREVAAAFGDRRNVLQNRRWSLFSSPFLGPKEERLFLIGIVVMGNVNGSAHGIAKVVFLVGRVRVIRVVSGFPWSGVEEVVAQVLKGAAMETASAALRFHFNRT